MYYIHMNKVGKLGFTIVELLIVIVVIAVLAAVTVVAFNGIKQRVSPPSFAVYAAVLAVQPPVTACATGRSTQSWLFPASQ